MKYLLLTSLLLIAGSAKAQTIYPESASDKIHGAIVHSNYSFPATWHVYVVDDAQWDSTVKIWNAVTNTAFTVIPQGMTYIRKSYFDRATPNQLRHTLAHEMGHIACKCASEARAEGFAIIHTSS